MLTGVIDGSLLCCGDNVTWAYTADQDDIDPDLVFFKWMIHRVLVPTVLTCGIFGNLLILLVLSASAFRGIAYVYLKALELTQTAVLIAWIPISLRLGHGTNSNSNYLSIFYQAHLELVVVNSFSAASILIMACLIVDRYIFVFFPARIRTGNARKNVRTFIIFSLCVAFTVSVPLGSMRVMHEEQGESDNLLTMRENIAATHTRFWKVYVWLMEIVVRIGPSIIFVVLNSLVIKRFLQLNVKKRQFNAVSEKFRTASPAEVLPLTRSKGYKEEQNLIILTTIMVLYFLITAIPAVFVPVLYPGNGDLSASHNKFRAFSVVFELSNFAIHIFIYLVCNAEFRAEFLRMLQCKNNEVTGTESELPVGEIEDFSRHGTTVRLTPEHTKLNSPGSSAKVGTIGEERESVTICVIDDT